MYSIVKWKKNGSISVCVCVFLFFPYILHIKFVGLTSKVHLGGRSHRIFHPPSFCVRVLIFLARRIQPFLFLVDREVEFCVLHLLGIFYYFILLNFSEENPVYRDRTHVPTCQKVTRFPLSYRGEYNSNYYVLRHNRFSTVLQCNMYVCMYVCIFIKLHTTAQSGPVIRVILCHSH